MLNKNEQGRTMIEMLGVLAIMGIIVYGAIAGINYGMISYKITQTYNDIQDIAQGVEDLYSWSKNYSSLTMSALCKNDVFPDGCLSDNTARGQFGGNILVEAYPRTGANAGISFEIVYNLGSGDDDATTTYLRLASMDWCKNGLHQERSDNNILVRPAVSGECGA